MARAALPPEKRKTLGKLGESLYLTAVPPGWRQTVNLPLFKLKDDSFEVTRWVGQSFSFLGAARCGREAGQVHAPLPANRPGAG